TFAAFSDEVGVYKPDPAIFLAAMDGLGVDDPASVTHVGDLKRTDVAGARALGMATVRFRGALDDLEDGLEADHVVDRLDQIPAVLGLA
ncbi:MAG: HAD family hydrolase, partial [Actinomycetota bacterium]|nr:HAD family hydrolase [Actinomycetota bacterium]